jgi:energy-coupling factor transporter ATP-binding protein EcfA2
MTWRLDRVTVTYRLADGTLIQALRGVTLEIADGERVAVVGPNGSGKSALALCLSGLIEPSDGRVTASMGGVQGTAGDESWAAVVFQNPDDNLIAQTVREEIALTLEHTIRRTVSEQAIQQAMSRFHLEHLADRAMAHLSGGEKQRLAVACAFASRRPLIVLDEPTSHLDPPSRRELVELLAPKHETDDHAPDESTSAVFITQYPSEAKRFERVIVLDNGQISYDGPSAQWTPSEQDEPPARFAANLKDDRQPVIVTAGLSQIDQPGWPLPPTPLKEISLTVNSGDAIGLCGPIGAGKSTLAYHLAGLVRHFKGEIHRHGAIGDARLPVVLIQFPERQLFCPTVIDDVAWGPQQKGIVSAEARDTAAVVLTRLGLPAADFADRSPFALSGGQRRRVALAGVAACPATLYILDEPSAALDLAGIGRLEDLLGEWHRAGTAYVIVSHDLDWLCRVTNRVWVMDKGRICYDGPWIDGSQLDRALAAIRFRDG